MKQIVFLLAILLIASAVVLMSCSEDANFAESYSTHISGWMNLDSPDFHGKAAMTDSNKSCWECHQQFSHLEEGFHEGSDSVFVWDCKACHYYPHYSHGSYANYHAADISTLNWDLSECMDCHGANFSGGRTNVSCLNCHDQENGPVNCATCHSSPPIDDTGLLAGMPVGVNAAGAHQKLAVEKGYACTECHAPVSDLAHTGPLPAEVTFAHAVIAGANDYDTLYAHLGDPNSGNATCAVYCHSNGRGGPPNQATPEWTADIDLTCTACHSIPPVLPHPQVSQCHNCHSNVSPASDYPNDIRFLVEQLHVNGTVEL